VKIFHGPGFGFSVFAICASDDVGDFRARHAGDATVEFEDELVEFPEHEMREGGREDDDILGVGLVGVA